MKRTLNIIMGVAIFLSLAGAAWAANCGGGVPCSCGNTVNANTVLDDGFDSVVSTGPAEFCPGSGLTVNAGVTLNLGGKTIRGNRIGNGVTINGDNAVVTNGTIRGFNVGLSTAKDGGTISKIKALRNKTDGIQVLSVGQNNLLLSNQATENGVGGTGDGISIAGDDNTLKSNKANSNAGIGINLLFSATGNLLDKNTAEENSEDGIKVAGGVVGDGNTLTSNKASSNRGNGINVSSDGNTLTKNTANENFASGIFVDTTADSNTLEGNKADKNSGTGVSVNGKLNSLTKNSAKQNDGDGVFAKKQTTDKNIDLGGNKGTDNGGVGNDGLDGEKNCEIDEELCLP
ncbi:MAG: right-handed parallel beta-helix repeat-containing protein [Deltaproteobacteria bacterium]|nr:right-handed parallel beta-helix repeat-containing protein [Deltaproteobacteria bacterium]